ncbi:hypothetical protein BKA62DRAFT_789695 [Auriculariales sp. MPI-PUGE-AT-0066]|nr:hypothetical protein BKA62DRAFT_789695 [Auriculariales sp. MPI-PUGE-AT-0066]
MRKLHQDVSEHNAAPYQSSGRSSTPPPSQSSDRSSASSQATGRNSAPSQLFGRVLHYSWFERPESAPPVPALPQPVLPASRLPAWLVPPIPTTSPSTLPTVAATAPLHDRKLSLTKPVVCVRALAYFVSLVCYGIWSYYYIMTHLYPYPHRLINSTTSLWIAFKGFMIILGIFCSIFSARIICNVLTSIRYLPSFRWAFTLLLLIALPLILTLPFASFILMRPVHCYQYDHACDGWQFQAVLDTNELSRPPALFSRGTATFFDTRGSGPLFTFTLAKDYNMFYLNPSDADGTVHDIRTPLLKYIYYDSENYTVADDYNAQPKFYWRVTGTCLNGTQCLRGTYDQSQLGFDLQHNFTNGTPASSKHSTGYWQGSALRNLRSSNDADGHERTIMRMALSKYGDRTKLKVCIAGSDVVDQKDAVGPDVLVALGKILGAHSMHQEPFWPANEQ